MPECELTWEFKCPKRWQDLTEVRESVRYCNECSQEVYLVKNNGTALQHAREGKCVALMPAQAKSAGRSSGLPPGTIGFVVPGGSGRSKPAPDGKVPLPSTMLIDTWKSSFQKRFMSNENHVEVNRRDFNKKYEQWEKRVSKWNHVPISVNDVSAKQIKLDLHLAGLESKLESREKIQQEKMHLFDNWREQEKLLRFKPISIREKQLYKSLSITKRLRFLVFGIGQGNFKNTMRLEKLVSNEALNEFKNQTQIERHWIEQEAPEEYSRIAKIDARVLTHDWLKVLVDSIKKVENQLEELNWEAVYLDRFLKRASEDQARIASLQRAKDNRNATQSEHGSKSESELKRQLLRSKYDRSKMRVGKDDYKRGNKIDNYFKRHLRPTITTHFGACCIKCGNTSDLHLDHWMISKNEGGNFMLFHEDTRQLLLNVAVFCGSCNSSKSDQDVIEWGGLQLAEQVHAELSLLFDKVWAQDDQLRSLVAKYFELSADEVILANNEIDAWPMSS